MAVTPTVREELRLVFAAILETGVGLFNMNGVMSAYEVVVSSAEKNTQNTMVETKPLEVL